MTTSSDLEYFDARAYSLMLTVDHEGRVEIHHQAEPDRIADHRMARLAAEIIEQVGPAKVVAHIGSLDLEANDLLPLTVEPPAPGVAVLACRCGAVLDADQMHREQNTGAPSSGPRIARICCRDCSRGEIPSSSTDGDLP